MAQKRQLERDLSHARVTDFQDAPTDQVGVGSIVELRSPDGTSSRYTVLGAWDGDPVNHVISYKTPLGASLLGKKPGDTVKVKSATAEEDHVIAGISRYVG
jgi:transcription elongation GreA/GreB family factor